MTFAEKLGLLCRTMHRRLTQRVATESERPYQQLKALRAIKLEHITTQTELAERMCIDAPAASRLVDRLEADGLLKRRPGETRRSVRLEATRKANKEIAAVTATYEQLDAELRAHLTATELKTFVRILDKLTAVLASDESAVDEPI